ncbi:MAG: hypothetical protein ACM3X7_14020 [Solirubrobacterales bacterium]
MAKKYRKSISFLLCVLLILGNVLFIPKANKVRAEAAVTAAGVYVTAAFLMAAGITPSTTNDLNKMSTAMYNAADTATKNSLNTLGNQMKMNGLTRITIGAAMMNSLCGIAKGLFGSNPSGAIVYTDTGMGTCVTNSLPYVSHTSPLDWSSLDTVATFIGTVNTTVMWGSVSLNFVSTSYSSTLLYITMADGTKYQLSAGNLYNSSTYHNNVVSYAPVIYSYGSSTPDIKFGIYAMGGALGDAWLYYGKSSIKKLEPATQTYVSFSGNLYNDMVAHNNASSANANVNGDTYNNIVNNTYTQGMDVNVTKSLTDLMNLSASQITSTDAVSTNILDVGQRIISTMENIFNPPTSIPLDFTPMIAVGSVITTKFPFSIPFDLVNSFSAFNVAAVAPKWTIEFPSNYFIGGGTVVVDFAQFETWAVIIRWFILIIFGVGLIMATRRLMGGSS